MNINKTEYTPENSDALFPVYVTDQQEVKQIIDTNI